jgi:hypothetical protein
MLRNGDRRLVGEKSARGRSIRVRGEGTKEMMAREMRRKRKETHLIWAIDVGWDG